MVRRPALPPRRRTHRWRPAAWSRSARGTTDHRGSAGVLKGAPLSAVHAETADLLIPATAEIAAVRRPQRDRDRSCGASRPPVRDGLSVVRRPVASRWPCRRPAPAPRHRWRWALAALLFAGFVAVIASVGRSTLSGTGSALRHLDWAWIPPALVAEFTSMTAFARAQRRLLRGGGIDLRFVSVVAVTYAGNAISVSLPVAGAWGRYRLHVPPVPPARCRPGHLRGPHAFAAVLVYRLISFWLVMAAGWVVMAMLSRSSNVSAPKSGARAGHQRRPVLPLHNHPAPSSGAARDAAATP